jgi:FAD/FMN-containing dehydrogenase
MDPCPEHERRCAQLSTELAVANARRTPVGLRKSTSNLFRRRDRAGTTHLDVRQFSRVLNIDRDKMLADVEGMATYEALADETLRFGLLPAVVPQLKTITVGGAVSGLGIESSSFRFGLVHETVEEMEILLAGGRTITCSRSENTDLFFGFPNSYGTLGYVLRLKIRLIPAKAYVHLTHTRFVEPGNYFEQIRNLCRRKDVDYLDGTVFSNGEMYVTTGEFRDEAPFASDYTYMGIYYKSIPRKKEDWLTTRAYIWRWDTDWFWCSKHFGVQNPVIRLLATRWALNSRTYQRMMRLSHRILPGPGATESVIQDVDIPVENAAEFLEFLLADIGITPVWICPFQSYDPGAAYPLYALDPGTLYINFGFWDALPAAGEQGHFNKKVERKALKLKGKKGLYSTAYYDEETFWSIYNKECYEALKRKYDPQGVFLDLYAKCVRNR